LSNWADTIQYAKHHHHIHSQHILTLHMWIKWSHLALPFDSPTLHLL
jgi:hypothetical protein